jgi:ABC-type uncharacterized transport system fused permease/ATPase subunit
MRTNLIFMVFSFSEEIAFYQGDSREKLIINHAFQRLVSFYKEKHILI